MKLSYPIMSIVALAVSASSMAETIELDHVKYSGPIPVGQFTVIGDTTGLAEAFDPMDLSFDVRNVNGNPIGIGQVPAHSPATTLNVLTADFENRQFAEAEFSVSGINNYQASVDGKPLAGGKAKLHPATHTLMVKYVAGVNDTIAPKISITTAKDGVVKVVDDGSRMYTLDDVLYGKRVRGGRVSPGGKYMIVSYSDLLKGGKSNPYYRLYDLKAGKFVSVLPGYVQWMHKSDRYMVERKDYEHGRHLVAVDPADGSEEILAAHIPSGSYTLSPTDDFLMFTLERKGPAEDEQLYQVLQPDDRQSGWRDRSYPAIYRFGENAVLQPLALGITNLYPLDISDDGSRLLVLTNRNRMTQRPTTLYSLVSLDLNTMEADTIVSDDGFISDACFSPDGSMIAVTGSPEAFGRVGCTLPDDVIPNGYDYQLFIIDAKSHEVRPMTRDFDPCINNVKWSRYDNRIYMTVTERDMVNVYALDPVSGAITQVELPENVVLGIDLASSSPLMAVWGQNESRPVTLYTYNIKNGKTQVVDRPYTERLQGVRLGQCTDWSFTNSKGDTVYGLYYLPDNFDPAKQYPLIVNYYGGCSPTTRYFDSRYPPHVYASLGYVVLVLQPSGATGFGQEWASRHVSTGGRGVAEDIIEGTTQFCKEKPYINADKIGCIGASYGGFMTQYLLTQTDMFATGISHAGISDHTSYWGEGYWGYSYSETSMGEDLPWTNPDLYVKQSPLYNADKIHTPLLLLHGDDDHNVPVGESIQLFTALKRLGREVALVQVAGQDHWILADSESRKWQDAIFAWFAKYLQDDDTWWNDMFPAKHL